MKRDVLKFAMTTRMASEALSSPATLKNAVKAGWIKPVVPGSKGRSALYDVEDVRGIWERIKGGDRPDIKGVTSVELLGVLCIIAIIAALAFVVYGSAFAAGSMTTAQHNARILNEAVERYDTSGGIMTSLVPEQKYKPANDSELAEVRVCCRLTSSVPLNVSSDLSAEDRQLVSMGGPFLSPYQKPVISRNPLEYRAVWINGITEESSEEDRTVSYSASGMRNPLIEKRLADGSLMRGHFVVVGPEMYNSMGISETAPGIVNFSRDGTPCGSGPTNAPQPTPVITPVEPAPEDPSGPPLEDAEPTPSPTPNQSISDDDPNPIGGIPTPTPIATPPEDEEDPVLPSETPDPEPPPVLPAEQTEVPDPTSEPTVNPLPLPIRSPLLSIMVNSTPQAGQFDFFGRFPVVGGFSYYIGNFYWNEPDFRASELQQIGVNAGVRPVGPTQPTRSIFLGWRTDDAPILTPSDGQLDAPHFPEPVTIYAAFGQIIEESITIPGTLWFNQWTRSGVVFASITPLFDSPGFYDLTYAEFFNYDGQSLGLPGTGAQGGYGAVLPGRTEVTAYGTPPGLRGTNIWTLKNSASPEQAVVSEQETRPATHVELSGSLKLTYTRIVHPGTTRAIPWRTLPMQGGFALGALGENPERPADWGDFQWQPWISPVTSH